MSNVYLKCEQVASVEQPQPVPKQDFGWRVPVFVASWLAVLFLLAYLYTKTRRT